MVDDDAALRLLSRVNLELDGFVVDEAATVEAAEAAVRAARPDVVLLDVHLFGMETHSLRARLRADGIPVALVTYRFRRLAPEYPKLKNLERWYAAVEQRPAFRQHVLAIPFV